MFSILPHEFCFLSLTLSRSLRVCRSAFPSLPTEHRKQRDTLVGERRGAAQSASKQHTYVILQTFTSSLFSSHTQPPLTSIYSIHSFHSFARVTNTLRVQRKKKNGKGKRYTWREMKEIKRGEEEGKWNYVQLKVECWRIKKRKRKEKKSCKILSTEARYRNKRRWRKKYSHRRRRKKCDFFFLNIMYAILWFFFSSKSHSV